MQTLDPEVLALLAQEFIADAGQGIARMRQQLHATLGGADDEFRSNYELLAGLHYEVHKIKGTAGLCGFPSLTNMAGHFEAYLTAADGLADAKQLQQFINILGLLLTFEDARGAIIGQAALDCLPTSPGHPADSVIGSHEAVAVIASHDADFSARMCQYLGNMGIAAWAACETATVLRQVVNGAPAMVFVPMSFGGMSGVDFMRLLLAVGTVDGPALALFSDLDVGHADLVMLPEKAAVIPLGGEVHAGLQAFVRQIQMP
jgi:HPt (histidine-containing phosphotransfer) domain-containing protein